MERGRGPIVAIALVLCAVFVPTAFIVGFPGQFYKQFALTIAISTVISAFNSLTLSPALAALLLKSHDARRIVSRGRLILHLVGFSSCSTGSLAVRLGGYGKLVTHTLRSSVIAVV